jgi:hypothetical protein
LTGRMPGKRQAGWPFSLVTFSLATQRESNSAAAGRRKLWPLNAARASRTGCAPTGADDRARWRNHGHHSPPSKAGRLASASRICALLAIAVILAT